MTTTITIAALALAVLILLIANGVNIKLQLKQRKLFNHAAEIHRQDQAQIRELQARLKDAKDALIMQQSDARIDKQDFEEHARQALAIVAGAK